MLPTPIPLPSLGLIEVHGPQAADLLQAQLTQDLRELPADAARMAAFCTPQGRALADLLVWRDADGGLATLVDAALLDPVLKRLRMFILRLKCAIDAFGDRRTAYGLLLPDGADAGAWAVPEAPWSLVRRDGICAVRLPDAPGLRRVLLIGESEAGRAALAAAAGGDPAAWALAAIRAGVAHLGEATTGQFVPQMLNYELVGAVDFHKGCYPGQEVVARTQYRGQVKRRVHRLACAEALAAGDTVYDPQSPGEPCGVVINAAPAETGWEALAELRTVSLEADLRARAPDGPALTLLTLPYVLRDAD